MGVVAPVITAVTAQSPSAIFIEWENRDEYDNIDIYRKPITQTLTLLSGGYVECVATDIGKQVKDDGVEIGVLVAYDNTLRKWTISSATTVASGSAMTITAGTGAGEADGNSTAGVYDWCMDVDGTETSYLDEGLYLATQYCYYLIGIVFTEEDEEVSDPSNELCATTYAGLEAPSELVAIPISDTKADLTFKINSNLEDSVRIERKPDGGEYAEVAVLAPRRDFYRDTGLVKGQKYYWQVRVRRDDPLENSDYCTAAYATTISEPADPTDFAITEKEDKRLRLTWTDNSGNETGFKVKKSATGVFGGEEETFVIGANITEFLIRDLIPITQYWFRVYAYNAAGDSGFDAVTDTTLAQYEPTEFEKWIRKPDIKIVALCEANLGKEFEGFPLMKDDDLVACWPFDEGSGMIAYDKSKYENHGSLENMTEEDWVDGKVGKALDFDGENDYVDCGDAGKMGTSDFTIVAWVKPHGSQVYLDAIVDRYFSNKGYFISLNGLRPRIFMYVAEAYLWSNIGTVNLIDNEWNHLAITFDRDGNATCYVNGTPTGTVDISSQAGDITAVRNLYLGHESVDNGWFDGLIDEVRIYKRALTEAEVKQLHDTPGHRIHEIPVTDRAIVDFEKFYENGDEYTKKASKAQVQANASSFWLDPSVRKLYIHTSAEDNPSGFYTEGRFILHITNGENIEFNGNFYLPLLSLEHIPSMSSEISAWYGGSFKIASGTISFNNMKEGFEHFFDKRFVTYLWKDGKLILKKGGPDFTYTQYKEVFTSLIDRESCTDKLFSLSLMDLRANLTTIPVNKYHVANYPKMDPKKEDKVIPRVFGYRDDIPPVCIDTKLGRWMFHDGQVKQVHKLKVNDVEKTRDTHYYVDYQRAIITFDKSVEVDWEKDVVEIGFTGIVNSALETVIDGAEVFKHIMNNIMGLSNNELDHDSIYETKYTSAQDLTFPINKEEGLADIIHKIENSLRASTFQDEKGRIGLQVAQTTPLSKAVYVENFHIAKDGHSQDSGSDFLFKEINVYYKESLEEGKKRWEVITKALPEFVWKYGKQKPLPSLDMYTYFINNVPAVALAADIASILVQLEKGFIHETLPWLLYGCRAGDLIKLSRDRFYSSSGTADEITVRLLKLDKAISSKQSTITGVVVS